MSAIQSPISRVNTKKTREKTDLITSAFAASTPGGFVDIVAEIETLELVAPAGMTTPSP